MYLAEWPGRQRSFSGLIVSDTTKSKGTKHDFVAFRTFTMAKGAHTFVITDLIWGILLDTFYWDLSKDDSTEQESRLHSCSSISSARSAALIAPRMCSWTISELDNLESFKENIERKMVVSDSVDMGWTKNTGPFGPSVKQELSLALDMSRADSCCSLVETILFIAPG